MHRSGGLGVVALVVLIALPAAAPLASQSVSAAKVTASVRRVFGGGGLADTLQLDRVTVLRISRHDSLLGFARVGNVKGKDQPITYLVAVDPAGRILDIDILVYREPYGGEVAYEAWRKQFRGKDAAAPLILGRDIRNISGATISSNAVTVAVRRSLADFDGWRRRGLLR